MIGKFRGGFLQANVFIMRFSFAFFVSLVAQMIPIFQQYYHVPVENTGLFMSFQSLGSVLFVLFGAKLFDRFDKRKVLFIAASAFALLLFALSAVPPVGLLFLLLALVGSSNGTMDAMTNAITGENHPSNRSLFINLLHVFFGLGAITGPFFADMLAKRYGIGAVFQILGGGVCVLCAVYVLALTLQREKGNPYAEKGKVHHRVVLNKKDKINLAKICVLAYLMAGATITLLTWLSMYTSRNFGMDSEFGALALALYWGGRVAGLLAFAGISEKVPPRMFLLCGPLLSSMVFAAGLLCNTPLVFFVSVALMGVLFSNTEPQILVLAMNYFPQGTGFAAAVFAVVASAGVITVPYPMGFVIKLFGLQTGLLGSCLLMLCLSGFAMLLIAKQPKIASDDPTTPMQT